MKKSVFIVNIILITFISYKVITYYIENHNKNYTDEVVKMRAERAAIEAYNNKCNKYHENEKIPQYQGNDSHLYGSMMKIDCRYFIKPKTLSGYYQFSFMWPLSLAQKYSGYLANPEDRKIREKATINILFWPRNHVPLERKIPDFDAEYCKVHLRSSAVWKGIIVDIRFDDTHIKDWPAICQEITHRLNQVKEVK